MNTDALSVLPLVLGALLAVIAGYAIGARRSRRSRRELQRTLGARELELLESRAEVARLGESLADGPRRERVLRLTMTRLRDARERERRLFVDVSRLRLSAAESSARLRRAVRLARHASARVRELEASGGATGTITTCAPKSYGNGKAVTVSVVDHETHEARLDGAARVPHSERARFARLPPSNEPRSPFGAAHRGHPDDGLSAIDGLAVADEHRLNALGIHRLEQLAGLSEHEQRRLAILMGTRGNGRPLASWIGDARALIERRTTS